MPIVFAGIALLRLVALGSKVRVSGDQLKFIGSLPYRLLVFLGSAGALAVLILTWHTSEIWARAGLAVGALGIACGWPPTIVLDSKGIKRKLWWKPQLVIPWSDVSSIEENAAGDYEVYGQHQSSVSFSRFLIDPYKFKTEVSAKTNLKVTRTSDPVKVTPR
jgi:hypothetical protein